MDPNYGQNPNPENSEPQYTPQAPQQPQYESNQQSQSESVQPPFEPIQPQYQQNQYYADSTPNQNIDKSKNGMALASMILGIVSVVIGCCWFISIACAVVALILGILSVKSEKRGMAIAGIVLGSIGILSGIIIGLSMLAFSSYDFNSIVNDLEREFGNGGSGYHQFFD